jgi:PEGA domain-containing protein/PKD domain-containing protein
LFLTPPELVRIIRSEFGLTKTQPDGLSTPEEALMSRSSPRIPSFLRSSVSLALAAAMVVGAGAAETPKGSAAATGALSITTEPDGADVYVDGRLTGQTPANVGALTAGEHRVRIVKSGYLENARVVTLTAGEATRLNVKLTKTDGISNETAAGQVTSTGGGGGGGFPKWAWAAIAGGAVVGIVLALPKNKAPVPGTITVSPTATGMAGQTSFTFTSTGASDPDKDTLTKTWTSSDGGSGTGDTFTRTFATAGSFQVNLKVSDGKLDASAPAASVTVGPNMSATWGGGSILMPNSTGALTVNCTIALALSQSGTTLSGNMPFSACTTGSITLASGAVAVLTHPAGVTTATVQFSWTSGATTFPGLIISFSGPTNAAGTSMSGNITLSQPSSGFTSTSSTSFSRQ